MQLEAHYFNLLAEATDFQVRSIAAQLTDKNGKPSSRFMANPRGALSQAFAKATATEKKSEKNLSADAKKRKGFQDRLKQYETLLKLARNSRKAKDKKAREVLPDRGKILRFPDQKKPEGKPHRPAAAQGTGTTPFRLVASVQQTLEGLRLLVENE